jgi:hypothetical protein
MSKLTAAVSLTEEFVKGGLIILILTFDQLLIESDKTSTHDGFLQDSIRFLELLYAMFHLYELKNAQRSLLTRWLITFDM